MDTSNGFDLCPVLVADDVTVWKLRILDTEILFTGGAQLASVSVQTIGGRLLYAESATTDSTDKGSENGGRWRASTLTQ
jgi:hypothetical protein